MIQSETGTSDVRFEAVQKAPQPHIKGSVKADGVSRQLAASDCGSFGPCGTPIPTVKTTKVKKFRLNLTLLGTSLSLLGSLNRILMMCIGNEQKADSQWS